MESLSTQYGIRIGKTVVEPMRNRITKGHTSRKVTSREMDVLMCLIKAESGVVSRDELMESVWTDVIVNDDALTLAISRLRRAFSDNPRKPEYIETIPTRGYRLLVSTKAVGKEELKDQANGLRRYRIGMVVLALLLVVITSLFVIVRTEYEKVSEVGFTNENVSGAAVE